MKPMSSNEGKNQIPDQPNTIGKDGKRTWIFPTEISGKWQNLRFMTSGLLLAFLYGTPWIKINGVPFIRLSFLSSSFILFGSHILMREFYHFVLLALLLVLTLFIASAVIGRVWCGFACPQTVFIEQILGRVDRLFEGPAAKRKLDHLKPWTWKSLVRRVGKYITYAMISFSFAFTLVAIFTGPEALLQSNFKSGHWAVAFLSLIALFDAVYWREQFCHIACPYARFQGVMQDAATRTIGYDFRRGEPRSRHKRSSVTHDSSQMESGDCIDCGLCVRVCPSGIDIRQGATQLECIACARCVDACDGIMKNTGRPPGLIRYDSLETFESGTINTEKSKMLRPRVLIYSTAWLVVGTFGIHQFINRRPFHVQILGTSGASPWFSEGERVKNLLSLKVGNQSSLADHFVVDLGDGTSTFHIKIESPTAIGPIMPGEEITIPLLISADRNISKDFNQSITIRSQTTGTTQTIKRIFVGQGS